MVWGRSAIAGRRAGGTSIPSSCQACLRASSASWTLFRISIWVRPFGYPRVTAFMQGSFDYYLVATDSGTGYPADGNRLGAGLELVQPERGLDVQR